MIKAYNGEHPYVFVSYSHKDWQSVSSYIGKLQDNLCHIWFDEGIKSGGEWNRDLAEHLLKSEIILLFLSPFSVESEFVKSEINFGLNHNKKILPVYLEPVELPIDLEFQISRIQAIHLENLDENSAVKKVISALPDAVFLHTEAPFYIDANYSFYLKVKESSVTSSVDEREIKGFQISRSNHNGSLAEEVLFEYFPTPAYGEDAQYTVTLCNKMCDKYFDEKENGVIVLNLDAKFYLSYPLTGPDFSALLTFVIVNPNGELCSVKLVDCKIKTSEHGYEVNRDLDTLKRELWGSGKDLSSIEGKLC